MGPKPLRWIDFYASKDPVPNGPLLDDPGLLSIDSIEIDNFRSTIRDHNGYWDNQDQFVAAKLQKMKQNYYYLLAVVVLLMPKL